MAELLIEATRRFLLSIQGKEIKLDALRKELRLDPASKEWEGLRNVMFRLAQQKLVKPSGKRDGEYKVIAQVSPVTVFGRETKEPLKLNFPRDFETMDEMLFAQDIVLREGDLILISGVSNFGKGHPFETPILTDKGFLPIERVEVEDKVLTPTGKRATITGKYDRGIQDVYKFSFTDGSFVEVDVGHIWKVQTLYQKRPKTGHNQRNVHFGEWSLKTTQQVIDMTGTGNVYKYKITIPRTMQINDFGFHGRTPCPPYLLGLLLGDGYLKGPGIKFSTCEPELLDYLRSIGIDPKYMGKYDYKLHMNGIQLPHGIKKLSNAKFIPRSYLLSNWATRHSLLAGLLDTDGYVKGPNIFFTTVSKQLALDVQFIAESLGGKTSLSSKIPTYKYKGIPRKGQRAYDVYIRFADYCPFRLKRKRLEWKPYRKPLHRTLKTIEYMGRKPTICIATDSPDGLYLAKDFIVTHNTTVCMNFCGENLEGKPVLMGNEYTTVDGEPTPRFLKRIESMTWVNWFDDHGDRFTLLPVRDDYAEHVVKDKLNIIDWINIESGEHYLIGTVLEGIKRNLGSGIGIVALQKGEGAAAGRGGQFTKDFADLELLIDRFGVKETLLTIGKVKESTSPVIGRTFAYSIEDGVKIIGFREVIKCTYCYGKGWVRNAPCQFCAKIGYLNKIIKYEEKP